MRIKERISSMILLMLIVISSCSMLYGQMCYLCVESSHHTCCSCTIHIDDCATHKAGVDHNCHASHGEILEYLVPSVSISSSQIDNELYTYLTPSSLGFIPYVEQVAFEKFHPQNDDIVGVLSLYIRSLRAPPVLV